MCACRRNVFRDEAVEMLEVLKELAGPLRQKIITTVFRSFVHQGMVTGVEARGGPWQPLPYFIR
jgi:hypothetical protein